MLLVKLRLQCSFDFGHLIIAAETLFYPADDDLGGEVGVGDDFIWVGLLQADGAISASGLGAVVGIYGVVYGRDDSVSGVTLKLGDGPSSGGGHGITKKRWQSAATYW